jgi:hypothetical protein
MPHADMAESVDYALIGDNAVSERKLGTSFDECIGH